MFFRKFLRLLARPAAKSPDHPMPAAAARQKTAERPPVLDRFVRRELAAPAHAAFRTIRPSLSLVDDESPGYDPYNTAPVPATPPDSVSLRSDR